MGVLQLIAQRIRNVTQEKSACLRHVVGVFIYIVRKVQKFYYQVGLFVIARSFMKTK